MQQKESKVQICRFLFVREQISVQSTMMVRIGYASFILETRF